MANRYEYAVVELREGMLGGKMSGEKLQNILNQQAAQGWQLKAITAVEVKGRIGPGGVEERRDVMIGASLLAPNVRYPDHNHAPEEIYLVLTPGRFQHGNSGWFTPGVGGTLHNVPSIKHAMASEDTPFLAMWCLLLKR